MTRAADAGHRPGDWSGHVLDLVERIPAGRVLTYGDVAEVLASGSARSVGMVMSRHGAEVPWWRVVRADGSLHGALPVDAAPRWEAEATPRLPDGRVDVARARWQHAAPG